MEAVTELAKYRTALISNNLRAATAIEKEHGLYGFPPDIVCIGLAAYDKGEDVDSAIDEYLDDSGEDSQ